MPPWSLPLPFKESLWNTQSISHRSERALEGKERQGTWFCHSWCHLWTSVSSALLFSAFLCLRHCFHWLVYFRFKRGQSMAQLEITAWQQGAAARGPANPISFCRVKMFQILTGDGWLTLWNNEKHWLAHFGWSVWSVHSISMELLKSWLLLFSPYTQLWVLMVRAGCLWQNDNGFTSGWGETYSHPEEEKKEQTVKEAYRGDRRNSKRGPARARLPSRPCGHPLLLSSVHSPWVTAVPTLSHRLVTPCVI